MKMLQRIFESNELDLKAALKFSINYVKRPYREIHPIVTKNDYYICTIADFTNLTPDLTHEEILAKWDSIKSEPTSSPKGSGSKYKIKNGILYRFSDHWGKVASCRWNLLPYETTTWTIGYTSIKNMQPNEVCNGYFDYTSDAGEKLKTTIFVLQSNIPIIKNRQVKAELTRKLNIMKRHYTDYLEFNNEGN